MLPQSSELDLELLAWNLWYWCILIFMNLELSHMTLIYLNVFLNYDLNCWSIEYEERHSYFGSLWPELLQYCTWHLSFIICTWYLAWIIEVLSPSDSIEQSAFVAELWLKILLYGISARSINFLRFLLNMEAEQDSKAYA